jgi:hypothetical protein
MSMFMKSTLVFDGNYDTLHEEIVNNMKYEPRYWLRLLSKLLLMCLLESYLKCDLVFKLDRNSMRSTYFSKDSEH